ncbi:hypothetical protein BDV12DRAFT_203501 [Aspergillus spectabilis]
MPRGYIKIGVLCPRSFLFVIVANVGPGGASRSLAVAYRQGDNYIKQSYFERVDHLVADILAVIEILSDPANRALLEAERALAADWYRGSCQVDSSERPSVPDSVQPPWVPYYKRNNGPQHQPQLPWRGGDALTEFPFTTTCLLLGLLGDNGDQGKWDKANKRSRTCLGDVQLQPLSTVFRGDCNEYGLVVLDISDFNSGVKYGIAAFPVLYMAEVVWRDRSSGWNHVEDSPPEKEPDIVPFSPRHRVLLSIYQWLSKYYHFKHQHLRNQPSCLCLEGMPLVGPAALDDIWPPELDLYQPEAKAFWRTVVDDPPKDLWMDREKDGLTTRASSVTLSAEQPQNVPDEIDGAIDGLLVLTQQSAEPPLEQTAIGHLQTLARFPGKLRQRLEEVPDRLGSSTISSHVLRFAYAGCRHLNWVAFQNLPPSVIAAAIASDELQGAAALSLCVDQFMLRGDDDDGEGGGLDDLAIALAQSAGLNQLCLLQRPDRESDDASARFCSQLLVSWQRKASGREGGVEWLRGKSIYTTCAFSTSLRSRELPTPSSTISGAQVLLMIHMFRFVDQQGEDGPDVATDDVRQYQNYYAMGDALLDAKGFATRFLAYLQSLGSCLDSEKAILRFAHKGSSSSSSSSSPGLSSMKPIPAGFFQDQLPPNDPSRIVRLGDLQPGSWVVLVDASADLTEVKNPYVEELPPSGELPLPDWAIAYLEQINNPSFDPSQASQGRSPSLGDDDTVVGVNNGPFLHYSFIKIPHISADIALEQQQQQRPSLAIANHPEVVVVGGLTDFLRETAPGTDMATWEKQIEEAEEDLRTRRTSLRIDEGSRSIDMGVMAESRARALLNGFI